MRQVEMYEPRRLGMLRVNYGQRSNPDIQALKLYGAGYAFLSLHGLIKNVGK